VAETWFSVQQYIIKPLFKCVLGWIWNWVALGGSDTILKSLPLFQNSGLERVEGYIFIF